MSDVDVFVIDDDFDPLADLSLDDGERDDAEADYLPPIPDADKSVVPPVVPLSATERIEKLLAGIPGQQFRLLHAVEFCTEPKTMDEAVANLDAAYPNTTSVYGSAQVVQLLERDGALERIVDEDAAHAAAGDAADTPAEDEGFISVTPAPPCHYRATQAGLDAVAAHVNEGLVAERISEDERYLPIFQRVLEMCARRRLPHQGAGPGGGRRPAVPRAAPLLRVLPRQAGRNRRHRMARRLDHHRSGAQRARVRLVRRRFPVRTLEKEPPMSHDQETTIADVLRGRMATYQFLSRLFRVEVDQELYDTLMSMRFPANTGNALVDEGYRMICGYLSQADGTVLTELAVDYVRAFIGSGNDGFSAAYPYESVYTSPKRLMMQDARDEVLVLYRAFGLDKQESWKEGEDHIALELEFEQILCERAIRAYEAGDEDECLKLLLSQRNFLEDHLLAWYPMMAADLQKFPQTDFYKGLGKLTDGFLRNDREFLDAVLSENEADCHPERRPQAEAEGSRAASAETEVEVA